MVNEDFPKHLNYLRIALKKEIMKCISIKELANHLLVENSSLPTSFPVTVATADRSFLKLKID